MLVADEELARTGPVYMEIGSPLGVGRHALLQARNDELVEELQEKVCGLGVVAADIGQQVTTSNRILEDMTQKFDAARDLLHNTHARLRGIAKEPSCRNFMIITFFCVVLFVMLHGFVKSPREFDELVETRDAAVKYQGAPSAAGLSAGGALFDAGIVVVAAFFMASIICCSIFLYRQIQRKIIAQQIRDDVLLEVNDLMEWYNELPCVA
jgi:hypothetical protein